DIPYLDKQVDVLGISPPCVFQKVVKPEIKRFNVPFYFVRTLKRFEFVKDALDRISDNTPVNRMVKGEVPYFCLDQVTAFFIPGNRMRPAFPLVNGILNQQFVFTVKNTYFTIFMGQHTAQ